MTNASSQFLRSANSAATGGEFKPPSDTDVLNAVANPDVKDVPSLAASLGTMPTLVEPIVRRLSADGFLTVTANDMTLSDIGERALRYSKVANL